MFAKTTGKLKKEKRNEKKWSKWKVKIKEYNSGFLATEIARDDG